MDRHQLSILGLGLISAGLLLDNWRVGRKYEAQKKFAEILQLQNQAYHHMVRGLVDPNVDPEQYIKDLTDQVEFVEIITKHRF